MQPIPDMFTATPPMRNGIPTPEDAGMDAESFDALVEKVTEALDARSSDLIAPAQPPSPTKPTIGLREALSKAGMLQAQPDEQGVTVPVRQVGIPVDVAPTGSDVAVSTLQDNLPDQAMLKGVDAVLQADVIKTARPEVLVTRQGTGPKQSENTPEIRGADKMSDPLRPEKVGPKPNAEPALPPTREMVTKLTEAVPAPALDQQKSRVLSESGLNPALQNTKASADPKSDADMPLATFKTHRYDTDMPTSRGRETSAPVPQAETPVAKGFSTDDRQKLAAPTVMAGQSVDQPKGDVQLSQNQATQTGDTAPLIATQNGAGMDSRATTRRLLRQLEDIQQRYGKSRHEAPQPQTAKAGGKALGSAAHDFAQTAAMSHMMASPQTTPLPAASLMMDRVVDAEGLPTVDFNTIEGEKFDAAMVRTKPEAQAPAMARQISQQIIDAMRAQPDRPVELMLSPEELGRVRLSLSAVETGITVHVLAERPETTDLLRRHIDILTSDFRELGYSDINFSFGSDPSGDGAEGFDQSGGSQIQMATGEDILPDTTPIHINLGQNDGLDIRL